MVSVRITDRNTDTVPGYGHHMFVLDNGVSTCGRPHVHIKSLLCRSPNFAKCSSQSAALSASLSFIVRLTSEIKTCPVYTVDANIVK